MFLEPANDNGEAASASRRRVSSGKGSRPTGYRRCTFTAFTGFQPHLSWLRAKASIWILFASRAMYSCASPWKWTQCTELAGADRPESTLGVLRHQHHILSWMPLGRRDLFLVAAVHRPPPLDALRRDETGLDPTRAYVRSGYPSSRPASPLSTLRTPRPQPSRCRRPHSRCCRADQRPRNLAGAGCAGTDGASWPSRAGQLAALLSRLYLRDRRASGRTGLRRQHERCTL